MHETYNDKFIFFRRERSMKLLATYGIQDLELVKFEEDITPDEKSESIFTMQQYIHGTVVGGGAKDLSAAIAGEKWLTEDGKPPLHFALLLRGLGESGELAPTITVLCGDRELGGNSLRRYINHYELGGSNFGDGAGELYQIKNSDGTPLKSPNFVGCFSYNGRFWLPGEKNCDGPVGKRKLTLKGVI